MSSAQHLLWLPALVAASAALLAAVARCLTLLVGLLVALSKAARKDRPEIFREFARAVSSHSASGGAPYLPGSKSLPGTRRTLRLGSGRRASGQRS